MFFNYSNVLDRAYEIGIPSIVHNSWRNHRATEEIRRGKTERTRKTDRHKVNMTK